MSTPTTTNPTTSNPTSLNTMVGRWQRLAMTLLISVATTFVIVAPASAQDVDLNPTKVGAPGSAFIVQGINWAGQYALWSGLAAFVIGAGWWAWSRANSMSSGQHKGQMLLMGGAVAAIGVGLAPDIINLLTKAAAGGGVGPR